MAIESCRNKIKNRLQGITVYNLDKNEINETGVFLLYEGFYIENKIVKRRFGLYVAGYVYDASIKIDELLSSIENAFPLWEVSHDIVVLQKGELVSFSPDGFLVFKFDIEVGDFDE